MKLAFCLFKYFPYGGLQRDFLRIARACIARGHTVHVYTMQWEGKSEPGMELHLVPSKGWQNHARCRAFAKQVTPLIKAEKFDVVIGFNKMPSLDIYYAADVCYQARVRRQRGEFYRLLPRYRQMVELEQAVFARGNQVEIMMISSEQEKEYQDCYQTESERFHLLPPGIDRSFIAPENAEQLREEQRAKYGVTPDKKVLLMVGSGFKTKGVDRTLRAIAALSTPLRSCCELFVIGQDDPDVYIQLANELGIKKQIKFLGGRPDVANHMLAADLLLHPSYHENTGTVILEAMVSGLPVLTVEACGYAHYVREADAGRVLPSPFKQSRFNQLLEEMLLSNEQALWKQNGIAFSQHADIYSLPEKAADLIDIIGCRRNALSTK